MAIQAKVKRIGHSSGGSWWHHTNQTWGASVDPVPMTAIDGLVGVYEAELVPAASRGDEHTYVVEVTDTEDPSLIDNFILNVDASPTPNVIVEWTEQGDNGPTAATRAVYESPEAAAAASAPYADADKVEAVTIEYDEGTGKRSRYKQIES